MRQSNRTETRSWLQPSKQLVPAVLSMHDYGLIFSQSQAPILRYCRRPRTRASLPHSPRRSEDEHPLRAESVRGLSILRWQLGKVACCLPGCVGGQTLLGQGNPEGSRHWGRLLQDAVPVSNERNLASLLGKSLLRDRPQLLGSEISDNFVLPLCWDSAERCLALCRCADGIMLLYLC